MTEMSNTVLITGAGGFLGCALYDRLKHSAEIIGVDIVDAPAVWCHRWIKGSYSDLSAHILNGVDVVVHSAWMGLPGDDGNAASDLARNVLPSLELYSRCCIAGVKRFVFLSSGGTVYGDSVTLPTYENNQLSPLNTYGAGKASVEIFLRALGGRKECVPVILRIANPYGPGQLPWRGQGVIPTAIACAITGKTFTMWGDGVNIRDYIYVADASDAIAALSLAAEASGVYNVASGEGRSLNQVIAEVENVVGNHLNICREPSRAGDVSANVLSIERISHDLNWRPKVGFQEGITHCVVWLKKNHDRWAYNNN